MTWILALLLGAVAQTVAPARATITFELRTPGAQVRLIHGADARVLSMFPISIVFDTSQRWSVRATKPGYCPLTQDIDMSKPVFEIELHRGC